jgi:hypothetical protein
MAVQIAARPPQVPPPSRYKEKALHHHSLVAYIIFGKVAGAEHVLWRIRNLPQVSTTNALTAMDFSV